MDNSVAQAAPKYIRIDVSLAERYREGENILLLPNRWRSLSEFLAVFKRVLRLGREAGLL